MRQTRGRNDFVRGIGLEIQPPEVQADLAGNGPDMLAVDCSREGFIVESISNAAKLMQFDNLPEDDLRDTPFRISGENVSFSWGEIPVEPLLYSLVALKFRDFSSKTIRIGGLSGWNRRF